MEKKKESRKRQEHPKLRLRRRAIADLREETLAEVAGGHHDTCPRTCANTCGNKVTCYLTCFPNDTCGQDDSCREGACQSDECITWRGDCPT